MEKLMRKMISVTLILIIVLNCFAPGMVYAEGNEDPVSAVEVLQDDSEDRDEDLPDDVPDGGSEAADVTADPEDENGAETGEETDTEQEPVDTVSETDPENETAEPQSIGEPVYPVSGLEPQNEFEDEGDFHFPDSNSAPADEIEVYEKLVKKVRKALINGASSVDISSLGIKVNDYLILSDFMHSCPYIDGDKVKLYMGYSGSYYTTIVLQTNLSSTAMQEHVNAVDAKVSDILSRVNSGMSDLEQALTIHDYIVAHGRYDTTYSLHYAYSMLMDNKGVCQSYASLFLYLMNQLDIDTYVIMSESHEWNIIKIGGKYYNIDLTFDDPLYGSVDLYGIPMHEFFLISDTAIRALDSGKSHERQQWEQTCTDVQYDSGALWSDTESCIVVIGSDWYFVKDNDLVRYDTLTAAYSTIDSLGYWPVFGSSGFWGGSYSGLFLNGGKLYYNTYDRIRNYKLSTGKTSTVSQPDLSDGYIYGIADFPPSLKYSITEAPGQSRHVRTLQDVTLAIGCEHEYEYAERTEPSCTEDGMEEHYVCIICGALFDMDYTPVPASSLAIAAFGHTEVEDSAVEPTLEEDGRTAGSHCTVCGEWIIEPQTTYRVILQMNGGVFSGSGEDISLVKIAGMDLDLSEYLPVRLGYKFMGWSWDSDTEAADYSLTFTDDVRGILYACWKILPKLEAPTASEPDGSEITAGTGVSLTAATGAVIYYTTDGTEPTVADGLLYIDEVEIAGAPGDQIVLKAFAVKKGYRNSDIAEYTYHILDESTDWGDISEEDRMGFGTADDVPEELWVRGVTDCTYTGRPVKLNSLRVYHGKKLLVLGQDYTVSYKNNIKAGTAAIIISGKGNYSGKIRQRFSIVPVDLEAALLTVTNPDLPYTGKVQKKTPSITITLMDGTVIALKAGTDFRCSYPDGSSGAYKRAGTYEIIVHGTGNYAGTLTAAETIRKAVKMSKVSAAKIADQKYSGDAITPTLKLTYSGERLSEGTDYTVEYFNNTACGKATAIVNGIGRFVGTRKISFTIKGSSVAATEITVPKQAEYTGERIYFTAGELTVVSAAGELLTEGVHYTVSYKNNLKAGKATVTVRGIPAGGYTGSEKRTFSIVKYRLNADDVAVSSETLPYVKGGAKPEVSVQIGSTVLKRGTDYTVTFEGTGAVGTARITVTGKGSCTGTVRMAYSITCADIGATSAVAKDVVYKNEAGIYASAVTVRDLNGKKLKSGTDYGSAVYAYVDETEVRIGTGSSARAVTREAGETVGKKDVIPAGTVLKATVTGKENYTGTVTAEFRVVQASIAKATVNVQPKVYNGSPIVLKESEITVKLSKKILTGLDFDIVSGSYKNNTAAGTASVVIRGVGNYGGTKTVTFKIKARSMSYRIVYVANGGTGSMKASLITEGTALSNNLFKYTGKMFSGWNTEPDGSGIHYTNREKFTLKDGTDTYGRTIILYAQWH